jgi:hypothetical protein
MMSQTMPSPLAELVSQYVEAGRTSKQFEEETVNKMAALQLFQKQGHPANRRELALGITNIQQGLMWLQQYRRELVDLANEAQARLNGPGQEETS